MIVESTKAEIKNVSPHIANIVLCVRSFFYCQTKKYKMEEKILCAAVWYKEIELKKDMPIATYLPKNIDKGIVFCGLRHGQCIYSKCTITGLRDAESGENEQGFLTSKNRFVSREEGLQIALKQNQVIDLKEIRGDRLFSEDLY